MLMDQMKEGTKKILTGEKIVSSTNKLRQLENETRH